MEIELKTKARTAKTFKRVTNLDSMAPVGIGFWCFLSRALMLYPYNAHSWSLHLKILNSLHRFTNLHSISQHLFLTCSFTSLSQLLWLSESSQDPLPRLRHQHKESWNVVEPHILFKQAVKHWRAKTTLATTTVAFGRDPFWGNDGKRPTRLVCAWIGCIRGSTWHTDPR